MSQTESHPTIVAPGAPTAALRGERVGFNSNPLLTVALPAWRSKLLLFMLFVGFFALGGRAFYLMGGVSTEFLQRQGEARYARTLEVPATRGRDDRSQWHRARFVRSGARHLGHPGRR